MYRIAFCFVCLFSTFVAAAEPAGPATPAVEKLHAGLVQAMKGGARMGFAGRKALLDPIVREAYDLPAMARVATGAAWQKFSEDERKQVIDAFSDWTIATYASQFKSFDGESFVTKGETEAARGRHAVDTQIVVKGEDPTELNYQMREDDGHWKIVDVYLDGSVSQLALRRSEFAAVVAKGGATALVTQMKAQTAQVAKGG
jgi:phospholipid transport system substrate-binding protein